METLPLRRVGPPSLIGPLEGRRLVPARARRLELDARICHASGVCGGCARVRRTRIPVWTLVSLWRLGSDDAWLLEQYPSLEVEDLAAARDYAAAHPEEIQHDLQAQDQDDGAALHE